MPDAFEHTSDDDQLDLPSLQVHTKLIRDGCISLKTLKHALLLDDHFEPIINDIMSGHPHNRFELNEGILFRKTNEDSRKICLPDNLLEFVWFQEHYTKLGQHRTAQQITRSLEVDYYAPKLLQTFRRLGAKCYFCVVNTSNTTTAHPLRSTMKAERPREIWSFDVLAGLSNTKDGFSNIHLFIDNFSLYTVLVPQSSKSAQSIQQSIRDHIIQPFTAPYAIRSDNELGLVTSEATREFAQMHGITLVPTASAAPWSNGLAEGRIKTVKSLLRASHASNPDLDWNEQVYLLQTALNQTVGSHGFSPEEIMFGKHNVRPNDPLTIRSQPLDEHTYVTQLREDMDVMHRHIQDARQKHREQTEKTRNEKTKVRHFHEGQIVWVQNKIIKDQSGLICKKRGPYIIEEISGHSQTARLKELNTGKTVKRHFLHILPCGDTHLTPRLNTAWDAPLRAAQQAQEQASAAT
jgi:hypothetical protein